MRIDILSLFPNYFKGPFDESIIKRAKDSGLIDIRLNDIRNYSDDKFKRVDDKSFGGGPGMVMMPGPVLKAIRDVKQSNSKVIYLTPQGKPLTAKLCKELAKETHLVLLCGHYEGVDDRVLSDVDDEISIGDFVLTNGCLPAIVLVDAVARYLPGVLGNVKAALNDSFEDVIFDHPHYTKPVNFEGTTVPEVLQRGNHKEIEKWRYARAIEKTAYVRPDLFVFHLETLVKDLSLNNESITPIFFVGNLKRSIKHYCNLSQFSMVKQNQRAALFKRDDLFLVLAEIPEINYPLNVLHYSIKPQDKPELLQKLKKENLEYVTNNTYVVYNDPDQMIWYIKILSE
jgi:tRNA (guanine37-N1)-methyltransferase